jgi:hypothetical protein
MRATINYNHISSTAAEIEEVMAEIEKRYLAQIAEARQATKEPYTYKTWLLRRTKTKKYLSFDDYWAANYDRKEFQLNLPAEERIQKAISEEYGWMYIDDDPMMGPTRATFPALRRSCRSLYDANQHRKKMAHRFAEAINCKAASVTLSDAELSNCNYYRRMLL